MTPSAGYTLPGGIDITDDITPEYTDILTPGALDFVANLARQFESRRQELLQQRQRVQEEITAGKMPDFNPDTAHVRKDDWQVSPIPADLQDRRAEITGPVDRKMVINALNSGAKVFMADFEDAPLPYLDQHRGRSGQHVRCGAQNHQPVHRGRQDLYP